MANLTTNKYYIPNEEKEWTEVKKKKQNKNYANKENNIKQDKYKNIVYKTECPYNSGDEKNHKKILCNNMLLYKNCGYGDKCLYAHNLEDQNVDTYRKKAYDIIKKKIPFQIDLLNDKELTDNLFILTKTCPACVKGECPGGYNCKYGSISQKYTVCYKDLMYGKCENANCTMLHLSSSLQKKDIINNIPKKYTDVMNINKNLENTKDNTLNEISQILPNAKLLSNDFFTSMIKTPKNKEVDLTDSDDELDKDILEVLKECNVDLCKKSIFS